MLSELDNYLERIEDLHRQITGLLAEASSEALNWRPIEGTDEHVTNSLAVLTAHLTGAEHFWIGEVVGGHPKTRNREAEFAAVAASADELLRLMETVAQETRDVFSSLSNSDLDGTRRVEERTVPVRWCLLHVIDHDSLHLGHMQITYQLWSGGKGIPSPLWFERLPHSQGS
ncbi:MAG TPA: DinB family protein [Anaerolineales bacterium]